MKVILSESQLREIVAMEKQGDILYESLMNREDFIELKKAIIKAVRNGVAAGAIVLAIAKLGIPQEMKTELQNVASMELREKINNDSTGVSAKLDPLVRCITRYITAQGHKIDELKFSPEHLISVCESTGFDLPLLLAQMQCESNFGLNGARCKQTNSPFSVGLYDNGKNIVKYASQDEAIDAYIRLMQNNYLVNGKTVDDMLAPGGFVNKDGNRYASDPQYENKIKATRNAIISRYPELAS